MRYWVDPMTQIVLDRGGDPGDGICEEDCWMCMPCKLEFPLIYEIPNGR